MMRIRFVLRQRALTEILNALPLPRRRRGQQRSGSSSALFIYSKARSKWPPAFAGMTRFKIAQRFYATMSAAQWMILGLVWFAPAHAAPALDGLTSADTPNLSFSSVATHRFVASHGRQAVLMGYPQTGLEFLAYPLQIVSGYEVGFRPDGAATETDGRALLSRIVETPDSVTRIYAGPDYVVRETLFVPLDRAAALLTYQVDAARPLDIVVHFAPVLELMWPAALGGQSTRWDADASAYVMTEPAHNFTALIGSAQINAHDSTVNSTLHADGKLAFSLRAQHNSAANNSGSATATVVIAQLATDPHDAAAAMRTLIAEQNKLQADAVAHYHSLQRDALRLNTPDAALNDALAWAQVALDQSWVCNAQLGCGIVAGYGPSRPGRRPQYAWYFAGDGMVATQALISAGSFARARDELEFIARYQDKTTGMVWHELAQSANYVDWLKYPHMFVHVDISFGYLDTIARYVQTSGDIDFVTRHWDSIAGAYRYCQSLINAQDHLPHIPADKSGGDEQHSPVDDLGLSTSWVEATQNFAALANIAGHADLSAQARQANSLARTSVAKKYWDTKRNFWIGSHSANGEPIFARGSGPGSAILGKLFSPAQNETLLDQIASATFQTDWGTRGIGSDSSIYAPWSYATGSIFAVHSTQSAQTFWQAHRPQVAWSIFRGIVPWSTLDAPGHIHEVLAGNYFRPQTESVPEQTWSSAGLLDAAIRGLFGIDVRGAQNEIVLQPHMPADWPEMSAENIRAPHSQLAFTLRHDMTDVDLELLNAGEPVSVAFAPEIPLGAIVSDAQCDGGKVIAEVLNDGQDTHAQIKLAEVKKTTHCHLRLAGGVSLILPAPTAQIGDASSGIKLTRLHLQAQHLTLDADVHAHGANRFRLQTPWKIQSISGASYATLSNDLYEIQFAHRANTTQADGYASAHVDIAFANP
jgi:glycogen debranching enzyme